jgi:hypothetical protein
MNWRIKMRLRILITLASLLYLNINFAREMRLEVKSRTELKGVPSASGIEFYADSYYVVGDNSAWLYHFNSAFEGLVKYQIHDPLNQVNDTIPKKVKPDFEATTLVTSSNQAQLYIFGSGSKSPMRDILVKVDLNNPRNYESLSLEKFYLKLKADGVSELNIEGAVYANDYFYLLNRADNSIIRFAHVEFEAFLRSPVQDLKFTKFKFVLPVVDNVQAAFSGATLIPGTDRMIFTASLEQTDNWIDDGAILGSYLGIINLNELQDTNEALVLPILENGTVSKVKIESVTVKSATRQKVEVFMVTDSDGGASELIEADLFFH